MEGNIRLRVNLGINSQLDPKFSDVPEHPVCGAILADSALSVCDYKSHKMPASVIRESVEQKRA